MYVVDSLSDQVNTKYSFEMASFPSILFFLQIYSPVSHQLFSDVLAFSVFSQKHLILLDCEEPEVIDLLHRQKHPTTGAH